MLRLKILIIAVAIFCNTSSFADEIDNYIEDSKSENRQVRAGYAETLGNYKDERAFKRLLELVQDNDAYVRWRAAESLAKFGDKRAVPVLKEVIIKTKDSKDDLRGYLVEALYQLDDESLMPFWIECLQEQDRTLTETFVKAMVKYDYRSKVASDILIKDLQNENEWIKKCAAYALAYTHETKAFDALLPLLIDSSAEVREMAILALGFLGNNEATPYIVLALKDDNWRVQQAAFYSLYRLVDPRASFGLIDALKLPKDSYFRAYAVVALGRIKSKEAVPVLLAILEEPVPDNLSKMPPRADAVKALGEIGDERAMEKLEKLFKDVTSDNARFFSSSGSGGSDSGSPGYGIPPLEKGYPITSHVSNSPALFKYSSEDSILNDPDYSNEISVIIKKAILKIKAAKTEPNSENFTREQYDEMMKNAQAKLESFKPAYSDSLINQLKNSKEEWLRADAAKKLGDLREAKALPYLMVALKDSTSDNVRGTVATALGKLGQKEAIAPLQETFQTDDEKFVREDAAEALCLIADTHNDIEFLRKMILEGKDDEIAANCLWKLGEENRKNYRSILPECLNSNKQMLKQNAERIIAKISDEEKSKVTKAAKPEENLSAIPPKDSNLEKIKVDLKSNDVNVRRDAVQELTQLSDGNLEASRLLEGYLRDPDIRIRRRAAVAAALRNKTAIPILLEMLKDEKVINNYFSYEKIMTGPSREYNSADIEEIGDDFDMVGSAISVLGIMKVHEAANVVTRFLKKESSFSPIIIQALGSMNNPEVISAIRPFLDNKETRKEAIVALAKLGDATVLPLLMEELKGELRGIYWYELQTAFIGIGKPAVPELIKLLKNDNPKIKEMAILALGAIGDKSATVHLLKMIDENNPKVTGDVVLALGRLGDKDALPKLIELYNNKKVNLRKELLIAFSNLADTRIKPILIEAAQDQNLDFEFRCAAIQTLGKIKDEDIAPLLEGYLKEDNKMLGLNAAYALCKSGKMEYESYLWNALNDAQLSMQSMMFLIDLKGEPGIEQIVEKTSKNKTADEKDIMRQQLQQMYNMMKRENI
ncbi:MAG: HEAT repeat domain-containing protein [Candidatus Omnitrophica bacterium]|nr:HEAT repeat domain-containing protein [Candidatus Omnitrophota bacterium]